MGKLIDLINKYLPPHMSIPLIIYVVIISGILYKWPQEIFKISNLQKTFAGLPISTILIASIFLFLTLLITYIYLCVKIHKKLRPKFGVLWDAKKEPYCPIHEKALSRHKVTISGSIVAGLNCHKCNTTYQLMSDDGKRINLDDAKKLL